MTTSGSYDFNPYAADLIGDALILLGAKDPEEVLGASDYSVGLRFLNMAVKLIATRCHLWTINEVTHTLTPGTESYTVGSGLNIDMPRPLRLMAARRTAGSTDIDVRVVDRQEYIGQPVKSTQSPCLMAYYDPQLSNGVLYVWPTGSTGNTTLKLTFRRYIQDFDETGDTPDLPVEWALPLTYQLAVLLAPGYVGGIPPDIKMQADQMLDAVYTSDAPSEPLMVEPCNYR